MNDNLLLQHSVRKIAKTTGVELHYEVEPEGMIVSLFLEKCVLSTGEYASYAWTVIVSRGAVVSDRRELMAEGTTATMGEIYEGVLDVLAVLRETYGWRMDRWELMRLDIAEFLGQPTKINLN
jgi:hypothetical protein